MDPQREPNNVTRLPGADDLIVREPPHNFEAEQALLGAILVNNAAYQRVAEFLKPEHFADPLHGKLFDALSRLIERGQVVSAMTLKTYVEQDDGMKAAGGAAYLARLAAGHVARDRRSVGRLSRAAGGLPRRHPLAILRRGSWLFRRCRLPRPAFHVPATNR